MDDLLKRAAEKMGMPPALAERSAQARAEKEGISVEDVLREWAGESAPAEPVADAVADEPRAAPADEAPAPTDTPPASSATPPTEVTTDYLVDLAAASKRMPPKLVRSSAEARARNSKTDLDVVLATWAGVDLDDLRRQVAEGTAPVPEVGSTAATPEPAPAAEQASPEPPAEPEPAEAAAPAAPESAAPAAAAAAISMDELLEKVAEAKGMPAPIAKRSAEARAKKTGEPLEAVLAEWAGIDPATVGASAAPAPAAPAPAAAAEPAPGAAATPAEQAPDVEVLEPAASSASAAEAGDAPEASMRERGYPAWLAAAFVIIPILAVTYILVAPNGPDCGVAGQLLVDEVTGLAVNCDGSEYGSTSVDFLAIGSGQYSGCLACHGANGEGGVGPAFSGGAVLVTFPTGSCNDHIEWIRLGTAGWPDDTYGATNKPVGGGGNMPAFGNLTDEQLAAVALYERVQFGGQPLEEAELDCGLAEGEDGEMTEEMVEAGS
ncbi:MAG: cytochrome c [Deltaproteobacteria bacterium]|nr:cytochrome c [Deltaproteobacteria bacterium]